MSVSQCLETNLVGGSIMAEEWFSQIRRPWQIPDAIDVASQEAAAMNSANMRLNNNYCYIVASVNFIMFHVGPLSPVWQER